MSSIFAGGHFAGHLEAMKAADKLILKQLGHADCVQTIAELTRERDEARASANTCGVQLSAVSRELGQIEGRTETAEAEITRIRGVILAAHRSSTHKAMGQVIRTEVESWTVPAGAVTNG